MCVLAEEEEEDDDDEKPSNKGKSQTVKKGEKGKSKLGEDLQESKKASSTATKKPRSRRTTWELRGGDKSIEDRLLEITIL